MSKRRENHEDNRNPQRTFAVQYAKTGNHIDHADHKKQSVILYIPKKELHGPRGECQHEQPSR